MRRGPCWRSECQRACYYPDVCSESDPDPARGVIAAGGCWCGEDHGHDWPGKTEGAPHPRKEGTT